MLREKVSYPLSEVISTKLKLNWGFVCQGINHLVELATQHHASRSNIEWESL